jgi:hypothetical protein
VCVYLDPLLGGGKTDPGCVCVQVQIAGCTSHFGPISIRYSAAPFYLLHVHPMSYCLQNPAVTAHYSSETHHLLHIGSRAMEIID